jgi:hypothetical protein
MVCGRVKVREIIVGYNPPWMPALGGGKIMPVPAEVEADVNIYILREYYNREHAEIR